MNRLDDAALRVAVAIPIGSAVVEIGVGNGSLAEAFALLSLDYHGCDPDATKLEQARQRLDSAAVSDRVEFCLLADGVIPMESDSFEWAFFKATGNDAGNQVLSELKRILKPGGWVWVAFDSDGPISGSATPFHKAGFVDASKETRIGETGASERIFRRVESDTPV